MVAPAQQKHGSAGGEIARGGGKSVASAFQVRDTGFKGFACRIAAARVFITLVLARCGLLEGRSQKKRSDDGTRGLIPVLTGMYGPGTKTTCGLCLCSSALTFSLR